MEESLHPFIQQIFIKHCLKLVPQEGRDLREGGLLESTLENNPCKGLREAIGQKG